MTHTYVSTRHSILILFCIILQRTNSMQNSQPQPQLLRHSFHTDRKTSEIKGKDEEHNIFVQDYCKITKNRGGVVLSYGTTTVNSQAEKNALQIDYAYQITISQQEKNLEEVSMNVNEMIIDRLLPLLFPQKCQPSTRKLQQKDVVVVKSNWLPQHRTLDSLDVIGITTQPNGFTLSNCNNNDNENEKETCFIMQNGLLVYINNNNNDDDMSITNEIHSMKQNILTVLSMDNFQAAHPSILQLTFLPTSSSSSSSSSSTEGVVPGVQLTYSPPTSKSSDGLNVLTIFVIVIFLILFLILAILLVRAYTRSKIRKEEEDTTVTGADTVVVTQNYNDLLKNLYKSDAEERRERRRRRRERDEEDGESGSGATEKSSCEEEEEEGGNNHLFQTAKRGENSEEQHIQTNKFKLNFSTQENKQEDQKEEEEEEEEFKISNTYKPNRNFTRFQSARLEGVNESIRFSKGWETTSGRSFYSRGGGKSVRTLGGGSSKGGGDEKNRSVCILNTSKGKDTGSERALVFDTKRGKSGRTVTFFKDATKEVDDDDDDGDTTTKEKSQTLTKHNKSERTFETFNSSLDWENMNASHGDNDGAWGKSESSFHFSGGNHKDWDDSWHTFDSVKHQKDGLLENGDGSFSFTPFGKFEEEEEEEDYELHEEEFQINP